MVQYMCIRRIRRTFAEHAVHKDYKVLITAARLDKLENIKAICPAQVEAIKMNIVQTNEIADAVRQAKSRFGRVHLHPFNN